MGNTNSINPPPPRPPPTPTAEAEPESSEVSNFTCEICIEPMLSNKKFTNKGLCIHPFCIDCVTKYIQVKVEDDLIAAVKCPGLSCDHFLEPLSCRPILAPKLFDKWCDVLCDSAILGFQRCYCPNRDCSALVVNECQGIVRRSVCPNCKRLFCFHCQLPWHAGYRCEESGEMRDRNDIAFGVLAERNKWMRCPKCNHCVDLIEGCSIVKCRCGTNFCYKCGRKVNQHWCDCNRNMWCRVLFLRICIVIIIILQFLFLFGNVMKLGN